VRSVKSFIKQQKEKLKREKLLINIEVKARFNGRNIYGYDVINSSKLLQDTPGMIDVDLRFDSTHFVSSIFFYHVKR
jgi:hypothetical protein